MRRDVLVVVKREHDLLSAWCRQYPVSPSTSLLRVADAAEELAHPPRFQGRVGRGGIYSSASVGTRGAGTLEL